jgi:hypothetical protein
MGSNFSFKTSPGHNHKAFILNGNPTHVSMVMPMFVQR